MPASFRTFVDGYLGSDDLGDRDGRIHSMGPGAEAALSYRTYTGEADLRRARDKVLSRVGSLILKLRRRPERPSRTASGVATSSQFPPEIDASASIEGRELRKYSPFLTQSLYEVFRSKNYLPCHCPDRKNLSGLYEDHICTLRLDDRWEVPGNETHSFFGSAVAKNLASGNNWIQIRIELPNIDTRVRASDSINYNNSHTPMMCPSEQAEERLVDVCKFFEADWDYPDCEIPLRIEKNRVDPATFMRCPVPVDTYLEHCAPIPLLQLLEDNSLSSRSKLSLAFTLSKSFWQYYDSEWMKIKWDLETIKILRQTKGTTSGVDSECRMPFLELKPSNSALIYCEKETQMKREGNPLGELHPYPYILALGILLVQMCLKITPSNILVPPSNTGNNRIYMHYRKEMEMEQTSWPMLDLHDEYRKMYREIVRHCLPPKRDGWTSPLFSPELDAEGRRELLMKHVVGPLHGLLSYANGLTSDATNGITSQKNHKPDVTNMIQRSQSERAGEWIECLRWSRLLSHVSDSLSKPDSPFKRPRIAIIDTGYDPKARGLSHRMRKIRGRNHWKDFWEDEQDPCDHDGHGTSMLSLMCDAAPFAEIFVARIARTSRDLSENPATTSENLAKAIHWAVNKQRVDVVSMSLGWEKEPYSRERHPVISNAILEALNSQDQKVLFFAATSNDGSRSHEFFPAKHEHVFSIRATDANGYHQGPNAALPESGEVVFGTLGIEVPTASTGNTARIVLRNGASPATAIAAGLATLVIGYTTINKPCGVWDDIRTHHGFQKFLYNVTNTSESRKRFFTLEDFYMEKHWPNLNHHLGIASWR